MAPNTVVAPHETDVSRVSAGQNPVPPEPEPVLPEIDNDPRGLAMTGLVILLAIVACSYWPILIVMAMGPLVS